MAKKTGTVKKKVVKVGAVGMAFVHSTFNNVIISITNEVGPLFEFSFFLDLRSVCFVQVCFEV